MSAAAGGCACCDHQTYAEETDWPADVSRLLYERLAEVGFAGRSVLEIGCGYGRLLIGALVAGARLGTGIELDEEALDEATERAEEAGVAARSTFILGDGAELELHPHDVVVLDRVICCYAAGPRLLERSLAAAGRAYAISVPESRGLRGAWNRVTYTLGHILDWLRNEEPVYLYDVRRMERSLAAADFQLASADRIGKWHVGIYLRPTR